MIISRIGRRHWRVRLLVGVIYAMLICGAVTMLYPFALMIAGSSKSMVDTPESRVVPRYLIDQGALYQKYAEALFNESFDMMNVTYRGPLYYTATNKEGETRRVPVGSFAKLPAPESVNARLVDAWETFCRETDLPFYTYMIGEVYAFRSRGVMPRLLRQFKGRMVERCDGDLDRLNKEMEADYVNWSVFTIQPEEYLLRRNKPNMRPLDAEFRKFKAEQPIGVRYYASPEGYFRCIYLQNKYGKEIEGYNKEHGTAYTTWDQVHLVRRLPAGATRTDKQREDWEYFMRSILNPFWIRADAKALPAYHAFLRAKYRTVGGLNRIYGTAYASFGDVRLVEEPLGEGLRLSDWNAFIEGWKDPDTGKQHKLAPEHLRVHSVDFMFRDYLRDKHGSIAAANAALGTAYTDWMAVMLPQRETHYRHFLQRTGSLRYEFSVRNFLAVIDYMVLHGRGIVNTVIYCSLAILCSLIVNPLAAYALSRYKPPSTYKVLLFLMLTMAFPPMVTQIPVFLMLREFHMLNTFFALIVPGMANGYMIFLLKGFFDSLPQELYESAAIDGAGEFRIFFQITMSLSKPILAVIALSAFTMAYSNFMMALLICQDEKMWTLMPWLYQLQQRSGEGVVFASLLVAAIPTLLVFAFCQNIIMRGIVVPVEK